jgi:hypothetical protein
MWQHWQKIISEEAKKYGYGNNELEQTETNEIFEDYKETLKGVRKVKVLKPIQFAKLDVGTTYVLMYDTSYMGEPMYKLGADGKKTSGRISGKKIAKAIEGGLIQALKEETEETQFVEDGEIEEAKDIGLRTDLHHPKGKAVVTKDGKVVKIYRTERAARKHAMTGNPVKEDVEVAEQFKAGDKVKVPHKGKMVSGKIVRFDSGGTSKAQQHGGGYVVDVGEPASILVPKQKVQKEETEVAEANLTEGPYTVIPYPMITKGLRDAASPFSIQFVDYKGKVLYQYPKQVNSIQALPAHMDGIFKEMRDSGWLLRHGGASLKLWHRVNILDKDGKVVNSIAAFDVPKKRSEEFELSENTSKKKVDDPSIEDGEDEKEYDPIKPLSNKQYEKIAKELALKKAKRAATNQAVKQAGLKVVKSIGKMSLLKMAIKVLGKDGARMLLSKIPVVGLALGTVFAVNRLAKGEFIKAGLELVSGVASTFPGYGTAAALAVDGALITGDIYKMKKMQDDLMLVRSGKMTEDEYKKKYKLDKLKAESFNHPRFEEFDSAVKILTESGIDPSLEVDDEVIDILFEELDREDNWIDIHESAALLAKTTAKEINAKARELGVKIIVQSNTSVSFSKNFTRGSKEEFFKAYSDCDKVRRMVRFKSRVNEWGASTGGVGLGAQDAIVKGVVTIHKSGDGAAYLLKELDKFN